MSTPLADVLQISALVVALVLVHRPFGDYMAAVYSSRKHLRAERLIYRWIGADPDVEMSWTAYLRSVLAFSAVGVLFLYLLLRVQDLLPLSLGFGGFPAFVGTLAESLLLAAIGGLLGAAATYLIFDGVTASTLGGNFTQVVFDFKLSPWLIAEGVALALIVGLIGGLFPALRAARLPIVEGLYAH